MTTNGFLFAGRQSALHAAGLHRISFSLDSLDRENFQKMTGREDLGSLKASRSHRNSDWQPVKSECGDYPGINDHEIERTWRSSRVSAAH